MEGATHASEPFLTSDQIASLVARAKEGDRSAWERLVRCLAPIVWKTIHAIGLPPESARDASQATWLRAVEKLGDLRLDTHFPGWLATIAEREALAIIRKSSRLQFEDDLGLTVPSYDDDEVGRAEVRRAVRQAFHQLSPRCRQLLALFSTDPPTSYADIGAIMDMPHGAIGPTKSRCLKSLREKSPLRELLDDVEGD